MLVLRPANGSIDDLHAVREERVKMNMEENERALADRQEPMNHGRRTRDLFLLPWAAMAGAVQQTVCARPHRTAGNCRLHDAAALTPRHPRKMAAEDNNEEMNQRPVGVGFGSWGDGEPGTGKSEL